VGVSCGVGFGTGKGCLVSCSRFCIWNWLLCGVSSRLLLGGVANCCPRYGRNEGVGDIVAGLVVVSCSVGT
jgi:hypothetical protein